MKYLYRLNEDAVCGAPPAFDFCKPLVGKFVSLSPPAADAKVFAKLYECSHGDAARESVWRFLPYGRFADAKEMHECYLQMAAGGVHFYAVQHPDGVAGVVSYLRNNPDSRSIEIGHIWHAANKQRGRANTESAYLLMDAAFAANYRRVEWKCNALNINSRRAALRLGMAFEGVFRRHTVVKGKNRDTAWFSLLAEDWGQVKAAVTEWLESPPGKFSLTQRNRPLVEWSLAAHDQWRADESGD